MDMVTATRPLTFEEYLTHDDGTENHYELVDGSLTLMTPPRIEHFLIVDFLDMALRTEIQRLSLPWLTFRETGLRTGFRKSRLTDLCVVTQQHVQELSGQAAVFQSTPLFVVEVVSPDSITRDYRYKRSEYAALAVPEYWIVDPLTAEVTLLVWEEGLYEETKLSGDQVIPSPTFPSLFLTAAQIFSAGTLSPS